MWCRCPPGPWRSSSGYRNYGVDIDHFVLAGWAGQVCWWLEMLYGELAESVFASTKLFADDTPMPTLNPGAGRVRIGRWEVLCVYLNDGRVEIDTDTVERTIRPIALNRRDALFAGCEGGGRRWTIISSLLETAKLKGVEPYAYINDVLERMVNGRPANRIADLLPWNWKPADVKS
jgi:hypothetical protein